MSGCSEPRRTSLRDVTLKSRTWNPLSEPRETIRYVDVSAVSRETLEISNVAEIPGATAPSRARKIVESGDIIFATIRPSLKRVAQVPDSLHGEVASTAFCVLRPNRNIVDPEFLFFVASNDAFVDEVAFFESGASHPAVRDSDVLDREIPLPPLPDQRQIARVLATARMALLHQSRSLAAAEDLKHAAMRELFTRGLRGEAQKETEIGLVPESWLLKQCESLAKLVTVGVVVRPASYYVGKGVPAFRSLNVREDRLDVSDLVFFSEADNYGPLRKSKLAAGDVLVVRTGYPGTSCVVPTKYAGSNCIDVVIVRPDIDVVLPTFLSRVLNSDAGKSQALAAKHGLAQQHLNIGALKRVKVPLPPTLDEQREIVTILDAIDRKIDLHKRKRAVLEELFKALLHKLMTREIRVADLDLSALKPAEKAEAAA